MESDKATRSTNGQIFLSSLTRGRAQFISQGNQVNGFQWRWNLVLIRKPIWTKNLNDEWIELINSGIVWLCETMNESFRMIRLRAPSGGQLGAPDLDI